MNEGLKEGRTVWVLLSKWKDYDQDINGVYTSEKAMLEGLKSCMDDFAMVHDEKVPDDDKDRSVCKMTTEGNVEYDGVAYWVETYPLVSMSSKRKGGGR